MVIIGKIILVTNKCFQAVDSGVLKEILATARYTSCLQSLYTQYCS